MHPGLGKRLISAAFIVAFIVLAAAFFPAWSLVLVIMAISAFATLEFYTFLDTAGIPNYRMIGLIGGVLLQLVTWASRQYSSAVPSGEWELTIILGVTLISLVRAFPQKDNKKPIITMAGTLLGFLYVPFLFNYLTMLLMGWWPQDGRFLIMYLLLVVKWTDAGAYFVGCSYGKHKLIPRISPAKTWEGLIGGLSFGVGFSLLVYFCFPGCVAVVDMKLGDAIFLGLLLGVTGTIGDLAESFFKRAVGVKDSSAVIRGMGGILDVVDSVLFTAPVLYVYARFFM